MAKLFPVPDLLFVSEIMIRKNDPKLLAIIDDGLLQLMTDPYWQKLKQKYDLIQ